MNEDYNSRKLSLKYGVFSTNQLRYPTCFPNIIELLTFTRMGSPQTTHYDDNKNHDDYQNYTTDNDNPHSICTERLL